MSGRGKGIGNESEGPKGSAGSGGPTINGSIEAMLTPELLFRMNKKIAQLTKDRLCPLMTSGVVYEYKCPGCSSGNYVGSTRRLLEVRADSHMGVSYRTGCRLSNPELSNIRSHARGCKISVKYENFKIIGQSKEPGELLLLESLNIKKIVPTLNCQSSAVPLFIA